jgi:DNA repair exonuclease SbcCD ATPase subunit
VKLLRLRVAGFGPLRGEWSFSPDKVNVVVDDNERGKTSVLSAIAAALYGLEDDRRSHRVLTPLERWRPWTGGGYGVELTVQAGGRTLSIARDFERGTVTVFDEQGREVTGEFVDGKDVPVGQRLLGIDSAEFEKCALVRQGDLDSVVPGDEKARRASTLRARLENAADTHIGDTNASEALRVLEESLRRYDAHELEFTGTVDNAIERLETKASLIEGQIHEIDHRVASSQEALDQMAALADDEHAIRETLRQLDEEKLASHAAAIQRQLDEDDAGRAELARLEAEAAELEPLAHVPQNAEAELREAIARHEEAELNLSTLESRRDEEISRERTEVEAELESLRSFDGYTEDDANACVALAADLRRLGIDDATHRRQVFELRDQLASQGYEPERIQFLTGRFSGLPDEQQRMLRQQTDVNLAFQTEVARLEQERTTSSETLRTLDASRNGRRVPGWFGVALGLGAAIGGGMVLAMHGAPLLWGGLLGAGVIVAGAGVGLLSIGSRAQAAERETALKRLGDAQKRLNQLRTQRAENELGLADLARLMGYRDAVDLMRHWNEYARMIEDSAPLMRAQELLAGVEAQKRAVLERARPLQRGLGDAPLTPEALERMAHDSRRAALARTRLEQLQRSDDNIGHRRQILEGAIAGLRERAIRILQGAGLSYDPERTWPEHVSDLAARMTLRARRVVVVDELVPYAKARLMPESEREERLKQLAILMRGRENAPAPRPPVDLDLEVQQARTELEGVQRRRGDLRVEFEEVLRAHTQQRPDLEAQLERLRRASARARAFKQAAELARATIQGVAVDTHRRWADFLNARVGELLRQFGAQVEQLRFGEDLDFSVQMDGGPQVSRGKAHLQLSAGARDQLYLAVRLAVSEYLSRGGEPLPLLFDDVFATSDDHRLQSGMRALIEGFATGHQLVVMTCHRGRHHDLMRVDPELYRERVHWLDVGAPAVSRA